MFVTYQSIITLDINYIIIMYNIIIVKFDSRKIYMYNDIINIICIVL